MGRVKHLFFCLILSCCLIGGLGCATPGPKFVDLAYEKHHSSTLTGMAQAPQGLSHILSADINAFNCKAQKKGPLTEIVLHMDLTFYLGDIQSKRLSTIPVSLTLERTELIFDPNKLSQFINHAFEEIIEQAIPFK